MTDNFAIERTRFARMARRNARAYLYKDKVRLKKYFYVLRPLLAIKHIEEGLGILPVRFQDLVDLVAPTRIRQAISNLPELKAQTSELGLGDPIPEIGEFIEGELERHGVRPSPVRVGRICW
ncbi:MAG TPA: nucleotidyltransferase domain-containing protein [Methylomirabilota bacterium]|nr:nucleotidyltransferase domain-containing protein [Methylomirabilota bacterium]